MKVSDMAREVGIAPSAVRFYERKGVLPPSRRGPNGYREYNDADLRRLRVVSSLRGLGLDLASAGRLAELCAAGHCDAMARDLAPLVAVQRRTIARRAAELAALDRELADLERTIRVRDRGGADSRSLMDQPHRGHRSEAKQAIPT